MLTDPTKHYQSRAKQSRYATLVTNFTKSRTSPLAKFDKFACKYVQRGTKNSCVFEFPAFLPPTNLPMYSPSALTEHVSLNLARFFFALHCT